MTNNLKRSLEKAADDSERIILKINNKRFRAVEKSLEDEDDESVNVEGSNALVVKKRDNENMSKYIGRFCAGMKTSSKPAERYVHWLSVNNIIDLERVKKFGINSRKTFREQNQIKLKNKDEKNSLLLKLNNLKFKKEKDVKLSLEKIENFTASSLKERRVLKLYQFIVGMHRFNNKRFNKEMVAAYSEADYIMKFWCFIIENHFETTDFVPHWGDTISEACKSNKIKLKLDFRLKVMPLTNEYDSSTGEFAKQARPTKLFGDKLKSIIATKAMFNHIVKKYKLTLEESMEIKLPILQVMGFEATVSIFSLVDQQLYVVQDVYSMNFPTRLVELNNGGIKKIYDGLRIIESYSKKVKKIVDDKDGFIIQSKMNAIINDDKQDKEVKLRKKSFVTDIKWPSLKSFK